MLEGSPYFPAAHVDWWPYWVLLQSKRANSGAPPSLCCVDPFGICGGETFILLTSPLHHCETPTEGRGGQQQNDSLADG